MTLNYRDLKDYKEPKDPKDGHQWGANGKYDVTLHGRKLSPRTLRTHFRVSPQFLEEAKNFVFNKESMSFTPILPSLAPTTSVNNPFGVTFAEMAVLPLNVPLPTSNSTITLPQITHATSKNKTLSISQRNRTTASSHTINATSNSPPTFDTWESVKEED
jgi:hypothetical protein